MFKKGFGLDLDYSDESVFRLDSPFFQSWEDEKTIFESTMRVGSYLGELLIKRLGGKWIEETYEQGVNPLISLPREDGYTTLSPFSIVHQRLKEGPKISIAQFYWDLVMGFGMVDKDSPTGKAIKAAIEINKKCEMVMDFSKDTLDGLDECKQKFEDVELLGYYVGEVIIRQFGGKWGKEKDKPKVFVERKGQGFLSKIFNRYKIISPFEIARKKIIEGQSLRKAIKEALG
jgi:hypothetical protein